MDDIQFKYEESETDKESSIIYSQIVLKYCRKFPIFVICKLLDKSYPPME